MIILAVTRVRESNAVAHVRIQIGQHSAEL